MITPVQTIMLITPRPETLDDAMHPFLEAGFTIQTEKNVDTALARLNPAHPPALILLDASDDNEGSSLRKDCMRVLAQCAMTCISATSPIPKKHFHSVMEGLGMLPPLPPNPSRHDGESLLTTLQRFLPRG